MRISLRGSDEGNAVLIALVLILLLSTTFIALIPRIGAVQRYAREYKTEVLNDIEEKNREVLNAYDLY